MLLVGAVFVGVFLFSPHSARAALYNASGVMGENSYTTSGIDGGSTANGFNDPYSIALDPVSHRLFVADANNNRVLVFSLDPTDNIASTSASYVFGQRDFTSGAATTTQSGFNGPSGLFYDATTGRLFVTDANNDRVMVFDASTSTLSTAPLGEDAEYVFGQSDFVSNEWNFGLATQSTFSPIDLAYDPASQRLFVADEGSNRVMVFDASTSTIGATTTYGENAEYVFGQTDFTLGGDGNGQNGFNTPDGVAYDPTTSRLFISDEGNYRVMVFDASTSTIGATTTYGENAEYVFGQTDFTSNTYVGTTGNTLGPEGLSYDSTSGRLYVADTINSRVMIFDASVATIGATTTYGENAEYVLGESDFITNSGGVRAQNGLFSPSGVAYDPTTEHLFVADSGNNRVMEFGTTSIGSNENALYVLGQTDANGNPTYTKGDINGGPYAYGLSGPYTTTVDPIGHRLFIADTNDNRVLVFGLDPTDNITSATASYVFGQLDFTSGAATTTQSGLSNPCGLAYDPTTSRLFISDEGNNRVMVFDASTSTLGTAPLGENAEYVFGQTDFVSGSPSRSQNQLYDPFAIAYDSVTGRLFVEDSGNRVMVFDASTSTIGATTTYGENAEYVFGQADFTSGAGGTTQNRLKLNYPGGLVYDPISDNLYVADTNNNRVMVFDASTSTIDATTTYGENAEYVFGQTDFTSGGGGIAQNELSSPFGLSYDPTTSRLFISDEGNNRVMVFDASTSTIDATTTYGEDAENVLGAPDFITNVGGGTTQDKLNAPSGLSYDLTSDRLFVADTNNNRVIEYSFVKVMDPEFPDGTVGSPYSATVETTSTQGAVSFSLSAGSLPAGLSLSTSTGVISGTPTTVGDNSFSVLIDDGFSTGDFYTIMEYTLAIDPAPTSTPPSPSPVVSVGGGGGSFVSAITSAPSSPATSTSTVSSTPAISSATGMSIPQMETLLASLEAQLQTLEGRASPTTSFVFTKNLSLGMQGIGVTELQRYLISKDAGPAAEKLKANGTSQYFGSLTKAALVEFQKSVNISPASGFFGPITRAYIEAHQ